MFAYTPQSDGASHDRGYLPEGYYPATVQAIEEGISKQGNDQLIVTLKAYGAQGYAIVNEYLVNTERAVWRIDRFLAAIGRTPEVGKVTVIGHDIIGSKLYVKIAVDHGETRDFSRCDGCYTIAEGKERAESYATQQAILAERADQARSHAVQAPNAGAELTNADANAYLAGIDPRRRPEPRVSMAPDVGDDLPF